MFSDNEPSYLSAHLSFSVINVKEDSFLMVGITHVPRKFLRRNNLHLLSSVCLCGLFRGGVIYCSAISLALISHSSDWDVIFFFRCLGQENWKCCGITPALPASLSLSLPISARRCWWTLLNFAFAVKRKNTGTHTHTNECIQMHTLGYSNNAQNTLAHTYLHSQSHKHTNRATDAYTQMNLAYANVSMIYHYAHTVHIHAHAKILIYAYILVWTQKPILAYVCTCTRTAHQPSHPQAYMYTYSTYTRPYTHTLHTHTSLLALHILWTGMLLLILHCSVEFRVSFPVVHPIICLINSRVQPPVLMKHCFLNGNDSLLGHQFNV